MKINRIGIAAVLLLTGILAGCGGGSTSSSGAAGTVNVALTDGPGDDYDHVWITVKAISFHTDPNLAWNINDATWRTTILPAPVTLDMANLTNGALNNVFAGMNLPVGNYRQIRLFLAGFDDTLTASASAHALTYNDQVDYTDATGTVHHVPLEIAYPVQGIQLNGTFNVTAGSTLNLAVDFDLEHDLVRFKYGTDYYFTMKPNLRYFDLDQSGAIIGTVNPAQLCTTTVQPTCGYNLIVKAEILSADGSRHVDARATRVDPTTGNFTLFPLPASGVTYDVLIRGRNIETMLVKGVTAPAGSTPASGAASLQAASAIPMTINSSEYFANFSSALAPTSGYAIFQQTLPASGVAEVPYEVRWGNTNPYTGKLELPIALANGPLHVASYNAGNALSFSNVVPQEGNGGYRVETRGLPFAYYNLSSPVAVNSAASSIPATTPTLAPSVVSGTVSGNITQTIAGTYDNGYLVLSRFANIVNTVNIDAILTANSGAFSVTLPSGGGPAGTASASVPGAYYYGYLRVWNSAHPLLTMKVIPINGMIDLRNTSTVAGLNVTLP
jgi:hypothetical protein